MNVLSQEDGEALAQTAHGNSMLALNCQFTGFIVIWLLSVADPEIGTRRASWPSNPADNLANTKVRG